MGALFVSGVVGCAGGHSEGAKSEAVATETSHRRPSEAIDVPAVPVVASPPEAPIVLGYFTNWAHQRPAPYDFRTTDVDATLFTHIDESVESMRTVKPSGVKGTYMRKATLSSTMGPGVRLELSSLSAK